MKSIRCSLALLFAQVLAAAPVGAAVYQYVVPVGNQGHAFLWIPPNATQVRGIICSSQNLLERNWLEDPIVREAAAAENLGIVYLANGGSAITWEMKPESVKAFAKMLNDLASESGYGEIAFAPILWMGHSQNGRTWIHAAAMPDRTIAAFPIRTYPMPETSNFAGIPLLYLVGQTTELPQPNAPGGLSDRDFFWPEVRSSSLALRAADPANLIGVAVYPGGTHTDWSDSQARFAALFIRKACQRRLPKDMPTDALVKLNPIVPESGWLTDSGLLEPDKFEPAPYKLYKGDPKKAYWFFDEEMARAALAIDGDRKSRELQMVTLVQDGKPLQVRQGLGGVPLRFDPEADGRTFKVEGGFAAEVPPGLIGVGTKLGHAESGAFKFRKIRGPIEQTGPNTFRVQFDGPGDGQGAGGGRGGASLMVEHPGDKRYRRAIQPVGVQFPTRLMTGKPQALTFPKIENQRAGVKSIDLRATCDSGLAAEYYVVAGPAVVDGQTLRIVEVPAKTRYPVKVTVVAYQWGRTIEPLHRSAEPIEQTFLIER
jgi:hypothetical protein